MKDLKKARRISGCQLGRRSVGRDYADAEQRMETFWSYDDLFRPIFERLNLASAIELAFGAGAMPRSWRSTHRGA